MTIKTSTGTNCQNAGSSGPTLRWGKKEDIFKGLPLVFQIALTHVHDIKGQGTGWELLAGLQDQQKEMENTFGKR